MCQQQLPYSPHESIQRLVRMIFWNDLEHCQPRFEQQTFELIKNSHSISFQHFVLEIR